MTARNLARHFGDVDKLLEASQEEIQEVDGIGPDRAEAIAEWFSDEQNRTLVAELRELGLRFEIGEEERPIEGPLTGSQYVITGTLESFSREEAKVALEALGAKVSDNVSKKTTGVFVGENPGSKAAKAEKAGVPRPLGGGSARARQGRAERSAGDHRGAAAAPPQSSAERAHGRPDDELNGTGSLAEAAARRARLAKERAQLAFELGEALTEEVTERTDEREKTDATTSSSERSSTRLAANFEPASGSEPGCEHDRPPRPAGVPCGSVPAPARRTGPR